MTTKLKYCAAIMYRLSYQCLLHFESNFSLKIWHLVATISLELLTIGPSTSNGLIFLVTSEPHKLWHWTPCGCLPRKNNQAYSFVIVYCMNFIFSCHFYLSFVPLLAPNPGDFDRFVFIHLYPVLLSGYRVSINLSWVGTPLNYFSDFPDSWLTKTADKNDKSFVS